MHAVTCVFYFEKIFIVCEILTVFNLLRSGLIFIQCFNAGFYFSYFKL